MKSKLRKNKKLIADHHLNNLNSKKIKVISVIILHWNSFYSNSLSFQFHGKMFEAFFVHLKRQYILCWLISDYDSYLWTKCERGQDGCLVEKEKSSSQLFVVLMFELRKVGWILRKDTIKIQVRKIIFLFLIFDGYNRFFQEFIFFRKGIIKSLFLFFYQPRL